MINDCLHTMLISVFSHHIVEADEVSGEGEIEPVRAWTRDKLASENIEVVVSRLDLGSRAREKQEIADLMMSGAS